MTDEFDRGYNQAIRDAIDVLKGRRPPKFGGCWNAEEMANAAGHIGFLHKPEILPDVYFVADDGGRLHRVEREGPSGGDESPLPKGP